MSLTQNEIVANTVGLMKQVPFRTKFERDNFLFGAHSGPRLLIILCQDVLALNDAYNNSTVDWQRDSILEEMNLVNAKIQELQAEYPDIRTALENDEPDFWVEHLARKAAVEALCQEVTFDNMAQMLKLPAELYEETITKCQTFLNIINKTTRQAERKANVASVPQQDEQQTPAEE